MYKIPMNVPVFIQDVDEDKDRVLFSKAKLKIFYIGETADHRLFTKDFAERVIETLPYTPVVAYYSEENDDFIGHNSIQYVYGLVPESAVVTFEKDEENNRVYAITDVILYTGRKDNIGKIASKIVGKQHSLELDPDSLKYKINRDDQGRFLNLEFISGEFVGLSVLGDNETPAFAGSEFFTTNEGFEEIVKQHQDKFNKFLNLLNRSGGKIEVFNSEAYFKQCANIFTQMSMQEFIQKIYQALEAKSIYGYVVENTEEYAVVSHWDEETGCCIYTKFDLTVENNEIVLGESVRVYAKYLTQDEIDAVQSINVATSQAVEEEQEEEENDNNDDQNEDVNNDQNEEEENNDFNSNSDSDLADTTEEEEETDNENCAVEDCSVITTNSETDAQGEFTVENAKESDEPDDNEQEEETEEECDQIEMGDATASASVATLSNSERSELEQYRREEKFALIAEYENDLSKELIDEFKSNVDNYDKDTLESKLAIEFRKATRNTLSVIGTIPVATTFGLLRTAEKYNESDPADVINKYKN